MKKWMLLVLIALLMAGPAYAELMEIKSATFQNAATGTGNGTAMEVSRYTSIAFQVTISDTATVEFEVSQDGSTWASTVCTSTASTSAALVTTATATGTYQCSIAGMAQVRARISVLSGGTVTVTGRATTAVLGKKGGGGGSGVSSVASSDTLPATCAQGDVYEDTDATSGLRFYYCDSTNTWVAPITAEVQTLDNAFDNGKTIDGANSLANAVRIGDGSTPTCHYTDATKGPQARPCTDADIKEIIPTNFTRGPYDEEGDCWVERIDPDAATPLAVWSYTCTSTRPKKSIWFGAGSLSTDGTNCAAPAEVSIASNPKIWTIICTENDSSRMHGSIKMPDEWDGGTITLEAVYIQTAADTGSMFLDVAAQCRGNGEAVSTYGTEVAIDDAAVTGSNKNDFTTSAAITPAGTCAAGDMLYFYADVDATSNPTTAAATLNFVGFKMEYTVTSRSS